MAHRQLPCSAFSSHSTPHQLAAEDPDYLQMGGSGGGSTYDDVGIVSQPSQKQPAAYDDIKDVRFPLKAAATQRSENFYGDDLSNMYGETADGAQVQAGKPGQSYGIFGGEAQGFENLYGDAADIAYDAADALDKLVVGQYDDVLEQPANVYGEVRIGSVRVKPGNRDDTAA